MGLPRPILIYVFGHELTHALWVWFMGGRVSRFHVTRDGGHVVTSKANFWIALSPYFFPIYSILAISIYGLLSLFLNMQPYGRALYGVIGATWAFHFTFTCWMIPKNQTDLSDQGTFFSLVMIYLMNLLLLSVMLILASPQITLQLRGRFTRKPGQFRNLASRSFPTIRAASLALRWRFTETPYNHRRKLCKASVLRRPCQARDS